MDLKPVVHSIEDSDSDVEVIDVVGAGEYRFEPYNL
jgi:hypothetical protein